MKSMPPIHKYMTALPHSIGLDQPLRYAKKMMSEYNIRHLPVEQGGKLVGILTDRDIGLASSFIGAAEMKVEDVMMPMVYAVEPETPLNEVVIEMAQHKYGCAVVQQGNGKVVGIFTATDAMLVLGDLLSENYRPV